MQLPKRGQFQPFTAIW